MKTTIYYFSATGNSLSIAKKLQQVIQDSELIEIGNALRNNTKITSEKIVFVFPVYAWGPPRIVTEFISTSSFENTKYAYSVCGCAGTACGTNMIIKKLLAKKNVTLTGGYILLEPSNSIDFDPSSGMIKFMDSIKGKEIRQSIDLRIKDIADTINKSKRSVIEKDSNISNFLSGLMYVGAIGSFKTIDKKYFVTDECNGCGICSKICKRKNITMIDSKPTFSGNCENCTACLNACPSKSLQSSQKTVGASRYKKKGIKLNELF